MAVTEDDARRHIRRYDKLVAQRGNFDNLYQEATEYIAPNKSTITRKFEPGARLTDKVTDSTAGHAVRLLAAVMAGSLTSQHLEWFHLKTREEELNQEKEVQDWLEDAEQKMYLADRQSNFQQEMHQLYTDLIFGTGCMFIEERPRVGRGFGGFRYTTMPWGTYVIKESPEGIVDTVYRCYEMTCEQIIQKWGDERYGNGRGRVPQEIHDAARTDLDKPYEIVHCVYPRTSYNPRSRGARDMPFASVYILRRPTKVLSEGGFEEFPYIVPRWEKITGEVYGRGPALTALAEVRTLNAAREQFLRAASKQIDQPVEVDHEGIVGDLELFAGGVNIRGPGATPGQPSIMPLETGGKLDWTQFVMADERQLVKEMFFWDQLSLQTAGANPTATEIERRWEIMRRVLGPTLGRLESEGLNPLTDRRFGLMYRAGSFGPVPEALTQQGAELDVEYEGPLARSQRLGRLAGVEQWIGVAANISAAKQDTAVWDNMEVDGTVRDLANILGLPNRYMTDKRKMEQMRAARTEATKQHNQLDTASQVAEAAGKAAPMLDSLQNARNGGGQMAGAA